ncbi:hypothetical protein MAR_022919 [Mya arenaria]|uniref:Uncharacterized protein n=1 Tax=Mya arenaria TaxID=6604 RepID=A0ABY7DNN8_MYAAR|nr:hypothetical protein MAR_022919 [Mya arenaria]
MALVSVLTDVSRVQMDYHLKCVICTKRTKPKERVPLSEIRNQDVREYFLKKIRPRFLAESAGNSFMRANATIKCLRNKLLVLTYMLMNALKSVSEKTLVINCSLIKIFYCRAAVDAVQNIYVTII